MTPSARISAAILMVLGVAAAVFLTARDQPRVERSYTSPTPSQRALASKESQSQEHQPKETSAAQTTKPTKEPARSHSLWIDELRAAPMSEVLQKHWPEAQRGNGDSMVLVHAIMRNCVSYRKRFDGKDISEVHARFAKNNDPQLNALNDKIWLHCAGVYANWDKYDGWGQMLDEAAHVGQPYAMVRKGLSNLSDEETMDEGLAQIVTAIQSRDPVAIVTVAGVYESVGAEPAESYSWLLAACNLGLDCSADGPMMTVACGPFSQTCGVNESAHDFVIREQGDYTFRQAQQRAKAIVDAVERGKVERLDVAEDLRSFLLSKQR